MAVARGPNVVLFLKKSMALLMFEEILVLSLNHRKKLVNQYP